MADDRRDFIRRNFDGRAIAPHGFGEPQQFFGVMGIGHAGGIGDRVADAVVDLRAAAGEGIAEIIDLDGGGFAGEGAEAVVAGMAGEVEEDVDLIGLDRAGEIVIEIAQGVCARGWPADCWTRRVQSSGRWTPE